MVIYIAFVLFFTAIAMISWLILP